MFYFPLSGNCKLPSEVYMYLSYVLKEYAYLDLQHPVCCDESQCSVVWFTPACEMGWATGTHATGSPRAAATSSRRAKGGVGVRGRRPAAVTVCAGGALRGA